MKLKGIDVSHHQGVINWEEVKSQIDYAILSVGYGDNVYNQDDKQFKRNADECVRLGIPFGVYIYSYAESTTQAYSEAEHVLRVIKGYKLDYPVYYDLEDEGTTGKRSNVEIANMAEVFCKVIESKGYWAGIYANTSWFTNKLTDKRFDRWAKWVAQYNSVCTYKGECGMWQYASDGKVNGINGNVDVNYCYVDYPSKIGGTAPQPSQPKPSTPSSVRRYPENGKGVVCVSGLNIRDNPSIGANVVGTYYFNDVFYYNEVIIDNHYVWVKYTSHSGHTRYVAVKDVRSNERYVNCY